MPTNRILAPRTKPFRKLNFENAKIVHLREQYQMCPLNNYSNVIIIPIQD